MLTHSYEKFGCFFFRMRRSQGFELCENPAIANFCVFETLEKVELAISKHTLPEWEFKEYGTKFSYVNGN